MKILLYGDSITDASRIREEGYGPGAHGYGYARMITNELMGSDPYKYQVLNRGISGNRITDLYARIKGDVWNHQPDVLSILVGVNDVWHEISHGDGTELDRFEKIYRSMIEETKERLPNITIMLCEPFLTEGRATTPDMDRFVAVKDYAKVVKKLTEEYGLVFVPFQAPIDECYKKFPDYCLADGVHPHIAGVKTLADAWLKVFREKVDK